MHAVDSEHKKNLLKDGWRAMQLLRSTSSASFPNHKFSTGDIDTLDVPDIRVGKGFGVGFLFAGFREFIRAV